MSRNEKRKLIDDTDADKENQDGLTKKTKNSDEESLPSLSTSSSSDSSELENLNPCEQAKQPKLEPIERPLAEIQNSDTPIKLEKIDDFKEANEPKKMVKKKSNKNNFILNLYKIFKKRSKINS